MLLQGLSGVWHFLPLETIASFCSLLVTAASYAWLSLAPKYRGPLPFLLGDTSTFTLSCAGTLCLHLGSQLCTEEFKDLKMSRGSYTTFQEDATIHTEQGSPY